VKAWPAVESQAAKDAHRVQLGTGDPSALLADQIVLRGMASISRLPAKRVSASRLSSDVVAVGNDRTSPEQR